MQMEVKEKPMRAVVAAVQLPNVSDVEFEASLTELRELAKRSAMASQLPPRGGPCIFGKIPVSTNWLGGRTDVILQLVFTPDGTLADGNFEEIRNLF